MANTYSSNLRLIIQTTGSNSGVWGDYVNSNFGTLLEQAITGIGAIAVSGSSNYTLSTANGASDESRNAILNVTGTLTAAINIVCPTVSKTYIIKNGTTGGYAVTLKTSAGTGISVPNGSTMFLYCDGTNVVEAVNYQTTGKFSSLTDTGLTSGRVPYASTGGLFVDSTNLTFDGTTLTAGGFSGPLNGTVGATTANTGAFTTLSASSTLTLSGGTANGVAYLNASKQVTSGSALTFDGTNFKTTGSVLAGGAVPSSGAGVTLAYNGSTTGYIYSYDWGASAYKLLNIAGSAVDISSAGNTQITFGINGSEQMRLTSTGLGIGTSSPAQKLTVQASVSGDIAQFVTTAGGGQGMKVGIDTTNSLMYFKSNTSNYSYSWQSGAGTSLMLLNDSGNLGLGVTPSAWNSSGTYFKAIELGSAGSALAGLSSGQQTSISTNAYFNNGWKYAGTGSAMQYYQVGGQHIWQTAPSGTAGNAISFTQAMTLDASGRLYIGTTTQASGYDMKLVLSNDSGTNSWSVGPRVAIPGAFYVAANTTYGVYLSSPTATSWASASDERIKTDFQPIENAAEKVCSLRAVTGRYTADNSGIRKAFLIAQDVLAVLPEAVDATNPEKYGLAYTDTIPLLVAAIQEQQAIIESLTARITTLEAK